MRELLRKAWHFIWEDNSILSWVINVILAFVIIKFLVYPGLGFVLATTNPVVAVVSGSMEHDGSFDGWWIDNVKFYEEINITKSDFETFQFENGFNKGDLMILRGRPPSELSIGNIIVFRGKTRDPVIHRLVSIHRTGETYTFSTKGDNNNNQLSYEKQIPEDQIIGQAVVRIPFLGYVKIIFTEAANLLLGRPA